MVKAINYTSDLISGLLDEISAVEQEKTDKRMRLSARINQGIREKDWKKIDFAKALNKRPSEISKWLSGTHNFNTDTLFDIERVLNIGLVTLQDIPIEQVVRFHIFVSESVKTSKSPVITWIPMTKPNVYQIETPGTLYSNEKENSYNLEYKS
jgi:hypothetical protein